MKQIIPDSPQYARDIAQSVMLSLSATVHWFKIPQDDYAREAMHRRWAAAVNASGLTEDQIGTALQRYLEARNSKDPVPEPSDIFQFVSEEDRDPMQVGLRRFLMWLQRAQALNARPSLLVWGEVNISGMDQDNPPPGWPELLENLGYPVEAEINRYTRTEIENNEQLEKHLEERLEQHYKNR